MIAAWVVAFARPARAELSGTVDGRALIGIDRSYGGALMADVWATRGWLRPGGAFGIAAVSAGDGASSRVLTPLALSLAFVPRGERMGFVAVARLGGYAGAQKGGLIGGGFASCTLGYAFSLGEGASLHLSAELWGLVGAHSGLFLGPAVGLGF